MSTLTAGASVLLFGRHRGTPITEVPTPYLEWLSAPERELYPDTRHAVTAELARRRAEAPETASTPASIDAALLIDEGVKALRRTFAGDAEAQRTIARVALALRAKLTPAATAPAWLDPPVTAAIPF